MQLMRRLEQLDRPLIDDTLEEIKYEDAEDVKTLEETLLKATTEQKNTELIRDTPEERQEINTIREHKNTDDSQIADTLKEIQNKDTEKNIEAIKTLEAIDLIASEEQKKTDGENPNSREARQAEKADEIETLGKTMLNATTEQKITKMQIPDPAEERQDKDGEGMEAQQKNPDEQRMDTTEKISDITTCTEDKIPHNLLNRYVLVQYDNEPYPGVVIDCDDDEVYVRCMHRVGRDFKSCSFYWPKAVKDECWYSIEDVLAIIPQPHAVGRKFYVDATLWKNAINKTKQNN